MSLSNYEPGQEIASIDFSSMIGGPLGAIVEAQSKAALSTVEFVKSVGFTPDIVNDDGTVTPGSPIYVTFKYPKMVEPYKPSVKNLTLADPGTGYSIGDILSLGADFTINIIAINSSGGVANFTFELLVDDFPEASTGESITGGSGTGAKFNIVNTNAVPAVFEEMKLDIPILTMMPIPFIRIDNGSIEFNARITSTEYRKLGTDVKYTRSLDVNNVNENRNLSFSGSFNYNKNTSTINLKTTFAAQKTSEEGLNIQKNFHMGIKLSFAQEEITEGMSKILSILEEAIVSQPVV